MAEVNTTLQLVADFVNTLDLEHGEDVLADASGLARWLRTRGLWDGRPSGADLASARAVREASSRTGVGVHFGAGALQLTSPSGGIGAVIAAAGQAMMDGSWQRLKACRADSCRWAFVDSSRNHSRQWCSMQVCGNREKARAYRRRRNDGA